MIWTIDYLIQIKYSSFTAHSTNRIGEMYTQIHNIHTHLCVCVYDVRMCFGILFLRQRAWRKTEIYGTEEFIFILIEFNNPKSYGNRIGYHMKCRRWAQPPKRIHSHRVWNAIETKYAHTYTYTMSVARRRLANKITKYRRLDVWSNNHWRRKISDLV